MRILWMYILSASILLPFLAAVIRFSRISKVYHPFLYFMFIGFANESLNIGIIMSGRENTVNSNIYMLLEWILLSWQFKRWGLFQKREWLLSVITIIVLGVWIAENFIFFNINRYNSYFLIIYSLIISLMSISIINKLIVTERKKLTRNATFIVCVAFVMYYAITAFAEVFWLYGFDDYKALSGNIQNISLVVNFISMIFFTVAIIWMPKKQKFTLPSS